MWSIEEIKSRGWNQMKLYYWPAVLASLIYSFLSGSGSGGASQGARISGESRGYGINTDISPEMAAALGSIIAVIFLLAILYQTFVGNPILVGKNRFYTESRALGHSAGVGRIFWVFGSGHYLNVVKVMFLRELFTVLWTLLLIIPGIVKEYEYSMIPYILSENPEVHWRDAFALTKDMMSGNKFQYFLLQLSFIGWIFLIVFVSVIIVYMVPLVGVFAVFGGILLLQPYMEASAAEVYFILKENVTGYPFNGFGAVQAETTESVESDDFYI